jgi:dTDP-6-deoxy-L-talose 4-dehydrogenase (NAD+)
VCAVDLDNANLPSSTVFKKIDILSRAADENLYADIGCPDVVIHLAWKDGFKHDSDAHLEMLSKHYRFITNMIDSGCKNISVMGSMHEVGYYEGMIDDENPPACNPMSLYGIAKNALRQAVFSYSRGKNVSVKWLRGFYITGDEERASSVFGKILQLEKQGVESIPFTAGTNKCDFIDVDELAKQIVCASFQTKETGIINVCSGSGKPLRDVVEDFIKNRGLGIRLDYGAYPHRAYDSPCVYGNANRITKIVKNVERGGV